MKLRPIHVSLIVVVLAGAVAASTARAQTGFGPPPDAFPSAPPSGAPNGPTRGKGGGKGGGASSQPSETPEPPQFTTLDGVWEIEEQPLMKRGAVYSHMSLVQNQTQVSGYWIKDAKSQHIPLTGTFDGRLIAITVQQPNGTPMTFNGYVDNFGDMVGEMKVGSKDPGTAFTAQHRKKEK